MTNEQVLLDEPKLKFKVGKFYNYFIISRTEKQIKLSSNDNHSCLSVHIVYKYKDGEFICSKTDYLDNLVYDNTYYHRIFDCVNTKRVIISTVDFFNALSDDDLVKLYNSKFDFSILDTPKTTLEVVQGEIVESAEQIKKEHDLSSNNEFKVGKFYNYYLTSRTKKQIKLSCSDNCNSCVGNYNVLKYKDSEFICANVDYLSGLSYDDTYYHRIFDCSNTKRVIISTVDFFSTLSDDDLVKLYNSKFDFSILDTPKVDLEVVQGEIVESAEQVHNRICDNFAIVEKTLYEICVDLKSIRDNKHYKTLGYNTFEDYCLENFNMSRFNAYKYISIAENLSDNFVVTSQQKQIGLNKLYVLSRLTDEERSDLIQTTDIEHTPVKQLEQKSREIKENRKKDVSDNIALEININPDKPTLTFKDVCSISFESSSLSKGCLFTYDNSCINNDLLSNYDYLTKTFNKLVSGKYDYNNLDTLSDLIEVSRRLADGIYDLKQYLKKKESN